MTSMGMGTDGLYINDIIGGRRRTHSITAHCDLLNTTPRGVEAQTRLIGATESMWFMEMVSVA